MLKPLTKEQTDSILSIAAEEFADKGFAGTAISSIAKRAGVSVGVIYKYYAGKEDLFNACVAKSLNTMEEVLDSAKMSGGSMLEMADVLITGVADGEADILVTTGNGLVSGVTVQVYGAPEATAAPQPTVAPTATVGEAAWMFTDSTGTYEVIGTKVTFVKPAKSASTVKVKNFC